MNSANSHADPSHGRSGPTIASGSESLAGRSFLKQALGLGGVAVVARALGFTAPLAVVLLYGSSRATDLFYSLFAVAIYVATVLSVVLESALVPYLIRIEASDGAPAADRLVSRLVRLGLGSGLALGAGVIPLAVRLLGGTGTTGWSLGLLLLPLPGLMIGASVLAGGLNARERFVETALAPLVRAVLLLAVAVALQPALGILGLPIAYVVAEGGRWRYLASRWRRARGATASTPPAAPGAGPPEHLNAVLPVLGLQVISLVLVGLNPVLDKAMALWILGYGPTALELADRVNQVPITLFFASVMVMITSTWSRRYGGRPVNTAALRHEARSMARQVGAVFGGLTALGILLTLALETQPLGPLEPYRPALGAWRFLALGLPFYLSGQVFVRALMIMERTDLIALVAAGQLALNVGTNLALIKPLGLNGIALSTSIVYAASFLVFGWLALRVGPR